VDNAVQKKEHTGQKMPRYAIVVPHKPGVQEWWRDAQERNLVLKLEGFFDEERAYLSPKMQK
jgi:hypothetical protein